MYNASGWMGHHNSDLWGSTALVNRWFPAAYWNLSSGRLVTHILEHYWYTGDKDFLASKLETISEAIEFYLGTLQPYSVNGTEYLVTNPSRFLTNSPQTTFVRLPTYNNATTDPTLLSRVQETQTWRPPCCYSTRYPGTPQEWLQDYKQAEPDHRRFSHSYTLYPGTQILPPGASGYDAKLFSAVAATFKDRLTHNGAGTGWLRAWTINWHARSQNRTALAGNTYQFLSSSDYNNSMDVNEGVTLIDGNLGFVGGVAEALRQLHMIDEEGVREVWLLPVLPEQWNSERVSGLISRGGSVFDFEWIEGRISKMKMLSRVGSAVVIKYGGKSGNGTVAVETATVSPGTIQAVPGAKIRLKSRANQTMEHEFI
ncbi:hypothetical protein G6011_03460 [Alternaria panax]|uniref:Glycoside hydrolase family 95 protein n=1 Tax=Alternaria panax TaxID=48097 RepID=A0AAD4IF38_9PLEO|nr:hypothetical protein G6011_03460 [Alternaria panax]